MQISHQYYKIKKNTEPSISKWTTEDATSLYDLECKAWAPWLRKPKKNFSRIIESFLQGQIKVTDENNNIIGAITTNRINWNGNPDSLPTWDEIAGGSIKQGDYHNLLDPNGNTLCLMSASIDPKYRGKNLISKLINEIINVAKELNIEHLVGSFRPTKYGEFKLKNIDNLTSFSEYCNLKDNNNLPHDPWLRTWHKYNMKVLRVENKAMVVRVPLSEFNKYLKTYHPDKWMQNQKGEWECGETGTWTIKNKTAIYTEANLWGEIPIY